MKLIKRLIPHEHDFVPIMYGLPSASGYQKAQKGKIILGGCCVPDNDLHFECKICGKEIAYKKKI